MIIYFDRVHNNGWNPTRHRDRESNQGRGSDGPGRAGAVILWLMDVNCRSQSCRALHTDELPHNCVFVQAALCKQKTRFVKIVLDRSVVFQIFCDCDDEGLTINNCGRWGFRLWAFLVLIVLGKCAKEERSGVLLFSGNSVEMFLKNVHWVT